MFWIAIVAGVIVVVAPVVSFQAGGLAGTVASALAEAISANECSGQGGDADEFSREG